MEITLKPTKKQDEAWKYLFDDHTKFVGFGGGAGVGKSWLICEFAIVNAFMYPGSRGFIARNELKRLMNSTYITFRKALKHHGVSDSKWSYDGKYNVITFDNGSTVDLLDIAYKPTDPEYERFGSTEYTYGAIEEAGETHFKAFDVLKSRIGRSNVFEKEDNTIEVPPKLLCTFNPSQGWIYRVFYKPWKNGTIKSPYAFVQGLYTDNPHTAKEYGAQLAEIIDKTTKERLMYGNWEYETPEGLLMRYENIVDIFTNTITKDGEKYMTVDVARYGGDKIVYNIWEGLESVKREYRQQQGTDRTVTDIRDLAMEYQIPFSHILIDEDGVGGGVVDNLPGTKGFVANSTPLDTKSALRRQISVSLTSETGRKVNNFANLKAQCGFTLADLVEKHKIAVKNHGTTEMEEITEDLSWIRQKDQDKEGKLRLLPKDEVKDALGRSPDVGDTFLMRAWFEVMKNTSTLELPANRPRVATTHSNRRNVSRGI